MRALPTAIEGYFGDRLGQHAAGIAYRVLFSLAPLAIVLVSIVGVVLQDDVRRQDVIDEIVSWLPVTEEGSNTVEEAITRLASPTSAVGLVSLLLFFWASTGMMGALRTGLEAALKVDQRRPAVRGKLVDVLLVAGAGALVIVMIAVAVAAQVVTRFVDSAANVVGFEGGLLAELLRAGVPLVVSTVVVMLLYRFVPSRRLRFGDAVAGGIVTGLSSSRSRPRRRTSTTGWRSSRSSTDRSPSCWSSCTPCTCTRRRCCSAQRSRRPGRRRRRRDRPSRSRPSCDGPPWASSCAASRLPSHLGHPTIGSRSC